MDRGTWRATVHGVAKSQTRLSGWHFRFGFLCTEVLCYLGAHSLVSLLSEINFQESGVQCLKTIVSYTLSWFSIVYRRRVYPVTGSIMPEVKVWYFGLPFIFFSLCCLKINKVLVTWLCPTFCDSMDYSRPGSSVHGILHARILGWVAIPFRKFSWPRDLTQVSCITGRFFTIWAARQPKNGLWYFCLCCLEELFDEFSKYPCPIDFYVLVWVDLTCSFQYVISLVKSVFLQVH